MPACSQITLTPVTVTSTGMTASNVDGVYDLTTASPAFTSAQSDISAAQATANGKNTVHYSASAPSGGGQTGDIWWQFSGGIVIGQWQYSGSGWVSAPIDNAVIANIDAGKITAGFISAARIAAGSLDASKITANTITSTQISSSYVYAGTIDASKINVGTLASGMTAAGTFYSTDINTSSLSATSTCYFYGGATVGTGTTFTSNGPAVFGNTVNVGGISSIASGSTVVKDGSGYLRYISSSQRYKQDIVPIDDVPELDPARLLDIPVRAYHFKPGYLQDDDPNLDVFTTGLIAEDVEAHYPVAALYAPDGEGGFQVENWAERQIIPGMLALIQRQHAQIAALTARIEALESI